MSKVILFPGMEEEKVKNKQKIELINFETPNKKEDSFKTINSLKKEDNKKVHNKKSNKKVLKMMLIKFIKSIMFLSIIFKKLFRIKAVRMFIVIPVVLFSILIVGMITFHKNEEVTVSPTTESAEVQEESFVESVNSEMDAQFKSNVSGDNATEENNGPIEITEDIVVRINPKMQGSVISSGYELDIKATLPKDKVSIENNVLEYKDKDIEFVLLSIKPNLSESDLDMMDKDTLDNMYKEMESLRKKAMKEISKDKDILSKVVESINNSVGIK